MYVYYSLEYPNIILFVQVLYYQVVIIWKNIIGRLPKLYVQRYLVIWH